MHTSKRSQVISLSINLTNEWCYLKMRGDDEWKWLPTFLPRVMPRMLSVLAKGNHRATFFLTGQDATMPEHRECLQELARAGHEIANHSFHYESWMHLHPASEVESDLVMAEDAIFAAVGKRPSGYRGAAFSLCRSVLQVLLRRGYLYDASILPTYVGPLVRHEYLKSSILSPKQRREREFLFGRLQDAFRRRYPFWWDIDSQRILEIPAAVAPVIRLPLNDGIIMRVARLSKTIAAGYLRSLLAMLLAEGAGFSLVLSPISFLEPGETKTLSGARALKIPLEERLAMIDSLLNGGETVTLETHAKSILEKRKGLPVSFGRSLIA